MTEDKMTEDTLRDLIYLADHHGKFLPEGDRMNAALEHLSKAAVPNRAAAAEAIILHGKNVDEELPEVEKVTTPFSEAQFISCSDDDTVDEEHAAVYYRDGFGLGEVPELVLNDEDQFFLIEDTDQPDLLAALSVNRNEDIRYEVARNEHTPTEIFERLSMDDSFIVLSGVMTSPRARFVIPHRLPEIIVKLSVFDDMDVLKFISRNTLTPPEVLRKLASHRWSTIRTHVAGNPRTPVTVLVRLLSDDEWSVRHEAMMNENLPEEILEDIAREQSVLIHDPDSKVREKVAVDSIFENILEKLSDDESQAVVCHVARNERTPVKVLDKICDRCMKDCEENSGIINKLLLNSNIGTRNLLKIFLFGNDEQKGGSECLLRRNGKYSPERKDVLIGVRLLDYLSNEPGIVKDLESVDKIFDYMNARNGDDIDALCALVMYS